MQHFPSAQIEAAAALSVVSAAFEEALRTDALDGYLYAAGPIEALPVDDFHVAVEVPEFLSRSEARQQRKLAIKARQLDRRAARAAKRSLFGF